jgi:NADP-dependent 3-hydroxy acid dehydrogenase YdfG
MKKIAFITGATSGIGRSTAKLLAENSFNLILCGRRNDRLLQLEAELSSKTSIITLCFDVRNRSQVEKNIASLPEPWRNIDILINNAGNAHGLDPMQRGNIDDWDAMIDINVKGLLYVSRAIIPWMVKRKQGHIINIGSIAGKEVYPEGNVYCASKYAVDAITQGMRLDLNEFNIRVSAVNPGLVDTEFSKVRLKEMKKEQKKFMKECFP